MTKKTILWIIPLIILSIAISYATLQYLQYRDKQEFKKMMEKEGAGMQEELTEEEKLIATQLEELEKQRQAANLQPLTTEDIEKQKQELETLRQESGYQPLTEEQIQKQMEELDKLRQFQNQ